MTTDHPCGSLFPPCSETCNASKNTLNFYPKVIHINVYKYFLLIIQANRLINYSGIYDILCTTYYRLTYILRCVIIYKDFMKLLNFLLKLNRKGQKNLDLMDSQEDVFVKTGRQQFIKLQELGLRIPIAVL